MPLMKSPSKKALQHNIKAEMEAHPDKRDQDLAIAYSVQRQAKKKKHKMAEGGPVSAKTESRPMPDAKPETEGQKPSMKNNAHSGWTDNPTVSQAQSNNGRMVKPIKHPRMVPSSTFTARLRDEEDHMQSSMAPAEPEVQPPHVDDEEGADRQGPPVHKMKMMAEGGVAREYGKGPEEDMVEHPAGLESDNDEMGDKDAMLDHMVMLADGGELDMDHEDSIAAAIMAKKARMMAEGGEVDLSMNADEEPNHEDQQSYEALMKENYSESAGLDELDQPEDSNEHGHEIDEDDHDKIEAIHRKMMAKRQFKAR